VWVVGGDLSSKTITALALSLAWTDAELVNINQLNLHPFL